jgi:hypothetical protein
LPQALRPTALRLNQRDDRIDRIPGALEIDVDHPIVVSFGRAAGRCRVEDAGAVDQNVNSAK